MKKNYGKDRRKNTSNISASDEIIISPSRSNSDDERDMKLCTQYVLFC